MDEKLLKPRRYVRYSTDLEILIHEEPHTIRRRITQISRGGCLIFPALPPQPTPHLRMSFRLDEKLPSINCMGEIIYNIAERGTGVALTEISERDQEMITHFFENTSPS